jgi:hypothetical protein
VCYHLQRALVFVEMELDVPPRGLYAPHFNDIHARGEEVKETLRNFRADESGQVACGQIELEIMLLAAVLFVGLVDIR